MAERNRIAEPWTRPCPAHGLECILRCRVREAVACETLCTDLADKWRGCMPGDWSLHSPAFGAGTIVTGRELPA